VHEPGSRWNGNAIDGNEVDLGVHSPPKNRNLTIYLDPAIFDEFFTCPSRAIADPSENFLKPISVFVVFKHS
jgi:hypothetical protein